MNVDGQFDLISLKNRKILLIGGAGFIGHNLALTLKSLGADVSIVDSLQVNNLLSILNDTSSPNYSLHLSLVNQRLELLKRAEIPVHVLDARDYADLSNSIAAIAPEVIVHLAAVAHANISNKDPYSTFDHSLRTLENALDSSRGKVDHFIYFSSSMAYGNFKDGFVTEDTPLDPIGIYGALKLAGEKLVIAYNQVFDLPYTIVRPSALYGERCVSRRVGQIFIENALQGLEISIAGDGSDRLDFTYIADLVQGIVKIIENKASRNEIFNITYGESRPICEIAEIMKATFSEVVVNYQARDKLTPSRGTLSIAKARKLLGYAPQFSIELGFQEYIKWYKEVFPITKVSPSAIHELDVHLR